MAGLEGGGVDGPLDSELYLYILDSSQLEAAVGSNELYISCHVLGVLMRCCDSYMQLACFNKSFWCLYVVRMLYPL
jgi:hypothetical protein